MANIRKIEGKTGTSYKITVTKGRDASGKQIRHYLTWTPPPGMTPRQAEKAAQRAAFEFENQLFLGLRPDDKQTFQQYAAYYLETKRAEGMRPSTLAQHKHRLQRVNEALGHIPIKDITPQHLNTLWRNLEEPGMHRGSYKATAQEAYRKAADKINAADLAAAAKVNLATVYRAYKGQRIQQETARKLAAVLHQKPERLFSFEGKETRLAPSTIRSYASLLSSVFSLAVKEGLLLTNPVPRSTLPKVPPKEAPHLEPEEIEAMLEALESEPEPWRVLMHFILVSGCRRGEACGLRWSKLDFTEGTVLIDRALIPVAFSTAQEGPTKTGKSRKIMLPEETLQMLRRHRIYQMQRCLDLGDAWLGTEDYVFTRDNGLPLSPNWVSGWISAFAKRHGLPPLHTHELRHTLASLLIAQGVDIVEVSRRLGHARTSTTLDIYAHAMEAADRASAAVIQEAIYSRRAP